MTETDKDISSFTSILENSESVELKLSGEFNETTSASSVYSISPDSSSKDSIEKSSSQSPLSSSQTVNKVLSFSIDESEKISIKSSDFDSGSVILRQSKCTDSDEETTSYGLIKLFEETSAASANDSSASCTFDSEENSIPPSQKLKFVSPQNTSTSIDDTHICWPETGYFSPFITTKSSSISSSDTKSYYLSSEKTDRISEEKRSYSLPTISLHSSYFKLSESDNLKDAGKFSISSEDLHTYWKKEHESSIRESFCASDITSSDQKESLFDFFSTSELSTVTIEKNDPVYERISIKQSSKEEEFINFVLGYNFERKSEYSENLMTHSSLSDVSIPSDFFIIHEKSSDQFLRLLNQTSKGKTNYNGKLEMNLIPSVLESNKWRNDGRYLIQSGKNNLKERKTKKRVRFAKKDHVYHYPKNCTPRKRKTQKKKRVLVVDHKNNVTRLFELHEVVKLKYHRTRFVHGNFIKVNWGKMDYLSEPMIIIDE